MDTRYYLQKNYTLQKYEPFNFNRTYKINGGIGIKDFLVYIVYKLIDTRIFFRQAILKFNCIIFYTQSPFNIVFALLAKNIGFYRVCNS